MAFERTFNLVGEDKFGELVLSDLAIVGFIGLFGLGVLSALFESLWNALSDGFRGADLDEDLDEDHRDDN